MPREGQRHEQSFCEIKTLWFRNRPRDSSPEKLMYDSMVIDRSSARIAARERYGGKCLTITLTVLLACILYSLVGRYQRFGRTGCLHVKTHETGSSKIMVLLETQILSFAGWRNGVWIEGTVKGRRGWNRYTYCARGCKWDRRSGNMLSRHLRIHLQPSLFH
jgi:hypothetical protein